MDRLQEFIYQKIGEASMCWDKIPSGVFETTRASIIAKDIIAKVEEEKKKAIEKYEWINNIYIDDNMPPDKVVVMSRKTLNELKNAGD